MAGERATQQMRGRPVTYAEACRAADRLITRAHNGRGEKSTMSIPVQASDDDVTLMDYLAETATAREDAERYKAALERIVRQDTYWRDGGSGNQYGECAVIARAALNPIPSSDAEGVKGAKP